MKYYLTPLIPLLFTIASYGNMEPVIDSRVMHTFNILFPYAKNIKWDEMSDSYVVHFTDAGIRSRIVYYKTSSLFYFTRYYAGEHLPYAIQIKLKKDYPGKSVVGVTEISRYSANGKALHVEYFVGLNDNHWLLNLRIKKNGRYKVLNRYVKQELH